jgi:hypothetical protein
VNESPYRDLWRITWRLHAKGPGVATFDYNGGGHDHRGMSQYEARNIAEGRGLTELEDGPEFKEWVRLGDAVERSGGTGRRRGIGALFK